MSDQNRPDPLGALRAAAQAAGIALPDGLLEAVLALETEATEQHQERSIVQANLRGMIEGRAKDAGE